VAIYNEILVGRYNRGLQKLLGMKGGPPAPQLASDITIAFGLETLDNVELRYLFSWNRYAFNIGAVAQAANTNAVKLRNPANSNVIAVIEQITGLVAVADNLGIQHGASATDYNTLVNLAATRLDPRGGSQPSMIASNTSGAQSAVAFGATIDNIGVPAALLSQRIGIIVTDHQEIPLLPGDAVQIATNVNNSTLVAGYMWRERFLEESERF